MNQMPDLYSQPLLSGLTGLSQAVGWNRMAGHPPAAVIAAHFFCHENGLEPGVEREVDRLVDLLVRGSESIWYRENGKPVTNAALFEVEVSGDADERSIAEIGRALAGSLGACRDSGHNTIFASLALKALHAAPQFALPGIIDGIVRLLMAFEGAGPGRAHVPGQRELVDPRELPPLEGLELPMYTSTEDMVAAVCRYVTPERFNTRGVGGPIHVVNHAAALLDLERLGYADLVARGLNDHREHLDLWLRLPSFPEAENAFIVPNPLDPRRIAYWAEGVTLKDQGGYEHRIKFLYGAHRLAEHIPDEGERSRFMETAARLW